MNAIVLLNGHYAAGDYRLIKRTVESSPMRTRLVAVDGGLAVLQKLKLKPHYWISDLDSAPIIKKGFLADTKLLLYPQEKDKTDGELALELCHSMGIKKVSIFGWCDTCGETDHLLGNLFLPLHPVLRNQEMAIEYKSGRQFIKPLLSGKTSIRGYKHKTLSIIPLAETAVISLTGVKYKAKMMTIRQGETRSLRNRITAGIVTISTNRPILIVVTG